MDRDCGIDSSPDRDAAEGTRARRREGARIVIGLALVVAAAVTAAPAPADSLPRPRPEPLWNAYPLDDTQARSAPTVPKQTAPTVRPTRERVRAATRGGAGDSGTSPLFLLIGGGVLLTTALAAVVASRRTLVHALPVRGGGSLRGLGPAMSLGVHDSTRRGAPKQPPATSGYAGVGAAVRQLQRASSTDAVLKRKRASSDRDPHTKLREKAARTPPKPAKDPRGQKVDALKAKLAEPQRKQKPRPANRAPASPPGERPPAHAQSLRKSAAPVRPAVTPACRIVWWRGYVSSEFHAEAGGAGGERSILFTSPSFRWRKRTPPPQDLPVVADAYAALVDALEKAGWVATGRRGREWYALEFRKQAREPIQRLREGAT